VAGAEPPELRLHRATHRFRGRRETLVSVIQPGDERFDGRIVTERATGSGMPQAASR